MRLDKRPHSTATAAAADRWSGESASQENEEARAFGRRRQEQQPQSDAARRRAGEGPERRGRARREAETRGLEAGRDDGDRLGFGTSAKAGSRRFFGGVGWIPACAGMTLTEHRQGAPTPSSSRGGL